MLGSMHFEATEEGVHVQTRLFRVNSLDKFHILSLVQRTLEISKKEFEFANLLIQSDLDKLLVHEQNTTEVSMSPEILKMVEKLKGDNHDEG